MTRPCAGTSRRIDLGYPSHCGLHSSMPGDAALSLMPLWTFGTAMLWVCTPGSRPTALTGGVGPDLAGCGRRMLRSEGSAPACPLRGALAQADPEEWPVGVGWR